MVTGGDGAAQVHLAHRATATGGGTALQETSVCTEHSMTLLFSQLLICSVYVFGKKEPILLLVNMLCLYACLCILVKLTKLLSPQNLKEIRKKFLVY